MSTVSIRRVSHSDILSAVNAEQLIDEYAAECSIETIGKINPQVEAYAALENSGMMAFFGVFDPELVGFATVLSLVAPHYNRKLATVESMFVTKAHRNGGTGRALMNAIEDHASSEKCDAIFYSAPSSSQFSKLLAASHSYICTNVVYCRGLN